MEEINTLKAEIDSLEKSLETKKYPEQDISDIMNAVRYGEKMHSDQKRASGEPYFIHPIAVAKILIELNLDKNTIIAAILHDTVEDTDADYNIIETNFGEEVAKLVDGVTKITVVKAANKSAQEVETLRKILIAMVKDVRVILIKLADKLHNMTTLSYLNKERQKAIAEECLEVYAPIAGQLGISWIKAELENLALKHLHPISYKQILEFLDAKKIEKEEYQKDIENKLKQAAKEEDIEIEISARVKNIYSIYRKMRDNEKSLEEIYDIFGIRILCDTANDCYAILGLVHKLWIPIERRFKDYIAVPKSNRYRSLHTTVITDEGKLLEAQIRSYEMHKTAEYGIAAHWLYKKGKTTNNLNPNDISLINRLMQWNNLENYETDFLKDLKKEILKDTIYVFTPDGDIFEMPIGSTAIDFAYSIHTEVGDHTAGAKADGYIIPLSRHLKNTQVIEIITTKNAHPTPHWLKIAKTTKAKSKIRHWLNRNSNLLKDATKNKKQETAEEDKLNKQNKEAKITDESEQYNDSDILVMEIRDKNKITLSVNGEKNTMINFARCCSPVSGDIIIGYISVGRGIIVHKSDCKNLKNIKNLNNRTIDVQWEAVSKKASRKFKVTARKTHNLFSEIEGAIKKHNGHLIEGRLAESDNEKLTGFFTMELDNDEDFGKAVKSIRTIPSIINIYVV
ncbi:MAG: RelA/SpoT family protein [Spirochaetaceae bacterium]|nr:RelA/SpoT family protein [Spirochaetaceae bacterium]